MDFYALKQQNRQLFQLIILFFQIGLLDIEINMYCVRYVRGDISSLTTVMYYDENIIVL